MRPRVPQTFQANRAPIINAVFACCRYATFAITLPEGAKAATNGRLFSFCDIHYYYLNEITDLLRTSLKNTI